MSVSFALLNELMGLVPNASDHGPTIDHFLEFCHWFMLLLFIGWAAFFIFTIFRFHHSRHPRANYHGVKSKVSAHLEFMVVVIEAILLLGFALPLWGKRVVQFPDSPEVLTVRVYGRQFAWDFLYPGPDGVFGRQSPEFVTGQNPMGIDPSDPAGKDDFFSTNELQLVNFRPTKVEITSRDVIHSLSLHAMRMDQDAIPGMRVPQWFRPTRAGTYDIVCAQLCGANHFAMRATMNVADQATYDKWALDFIQRQHPGYQAPAAPAPPGTTAPKTAAR